MDVVFRREEIMIRTCVLFICIWCHSLQALTYYEGTATFRGYGKVDLSWLVQFMPYNPIIVEAGAYCGEGVHNTKRVWPRSRVIAFEPNSRAYALLQKKIADEMLTQVETVPLALFDHNGQAKLYLSHGPSGNDPSYEYESSLLEPAEEWKNLIQGPTCEVPCTVLDDWCAENNVDHIDILRLDLEGAELRILKSSPEILKHTHIIILPSFFNSPRIGTANYFDLKDFLTKSHFVPLAHWYVAGERGTAVYVSEEMYDAYFVRCLGLGLGGILYP
jgi:FkbM family methyltransferase